MLAGATSPAVPTRIKRSDFAAGIGVKVVHILGDDAVKQAPPFQFCKGIILQFCKGIIPQTSYAGANNHSPSGVSGLTLFETAVKISYDDQHLLFAGLYFLNSDTPFSEITSLKIKTAFQG